MANDETEKQSDASSSKASWMVSLMTTIAGEVDDDRYHEFGIKLGIPREMSEVHSFLCSFDIRVRGGPGGVFAIPKPFSTLFF